MRLYYAHPMTLYGKAQERRDLATLVALGFDDIVNPSDHDSTDMNFYLALVQGCDVLAFRALLDGSIPSGIAAEIHLARVQAAPVFELPGFALRRMLTVEQTREFLHEAGER